MKTQCTQKSFAFHALGNRDVVARFDGGRITSDAGGLLLREVERKLGILRQLAACFDDHRDPDLIEHSVLELISQRVYALALGYEDLNDHDELRHDPLLAVLVGKADPTGMDRQLARDRGKACAGKSTLNRLELTPVGATTASRYKKIVAHQEAIEQLFVDAFLQSQHRAPRQIVLDLDATDDPVHGHQLGRFFHGYYGHYCYLPLYIFAGDHLLCAKLRPSDIDASSGTRAGTGADRGPDSPPLATGADRRAGRQRLLPREHHGLVRAESGRLRAGSGQKRAARSPRLIRNSTRPRSISKRRASRPACSATSSIARSTVGAARGV